MKPSETRKSGLAAREPREAEAEALERLQREPRVVDGLREDDARLAPRLLLGRGRVLEVEGRDDLLDRRVEGHLVAGLDHLRLVVADVGNARPVGVPALGGEPRERLPQDGPVGSELLRQRRGAARRDERDLVLGPQVLVEEALEGLARAHEALELHVDVVDREHDVARRQHLVRLCGLGLPRCGRLCRRRDCRRGSRERVELHDRLRLAVLEHDEVLALQAGPRTPALLAHHHLEPHHLDAGRREQGGRRLVSGRLWRRLSVDG